MKRGQEKRYVPAARNVGRLYAQIVDHSQRKRNCRAAQRGGREEGSRRTRQRISFTRLKHGPRFSRSRLLLQLPPTIAEFWCDTDSEARVSSMTNPSRGAWRP